MAKVGIEPKTYRPSKLNLKVFKQNYSSIDSDQTQNMVNTTTGASKKGQLI